MTSQDLFHDNDIDIITGNNGFIKVNNTEIHIPVVSGFCGGVLQALRLLNKTLDNSTGKKVFLPGQIIHNPTVNDYFKERGVIFLPLTSHNEIPAEITRNDLIVIPAFGLPLELDRKIREYVNIPENIIDTTCAYVKRIWKFASEAAKNQRTIFVHGKPTHPETIATVSRASTSENCVVVLRNKADAISLADCLRDNDFSSYPDTQIINLRNLKLKNTALVNQTTMLYSETKEIESLLSAVLPDLEIAHTLCQATQKRQEAAIKLFEKKCDLYLVTGGYNSSNTTQLYKLASKEAPTWFIHDETCFNDTQITHFNPETGDTTTTGNWLKKGTRKIGILSGASCPPLITGNIIRKLKQSAILNS